MNLKKDREGRIGINLACLRNVGVLSVGSLHVWGGALHVTAVVREILVHRIAESNSVQCNTEKHSVTHSITLAVRSRGGASPASRHAANIIKQGWDLGRLRVMGGVGLGKYILANYRFV